MYSYDPYFINQDFTQYVDSSLIEPQQEISSYQQTSLGNVSRIVDPDFYDASEYRAGQAFSFSNLRGKKFFEQRLNLRGVVNSSSKVFASITEVGIIGGQVKPFQGAASMEIKNVVPHDDGIVIVRGIIHWDSDLNYRISVVVF